MRIQTHGAEKISEKVILSHVTLLHAYKKTLEHASKDSTYSTPESALKTPFDEMLLAQIKKDCAKYQDSLKTIFLVGIGGSNLGVLALYDALRGYHLYKTKDSPKKPELVFFDTVEPNTLQYAKSMFAKHTKAEECILVIISKSGTTTETLTNANILFSEFTKHFGEEKATQQTIVIADEKAELLQKAKKKGITTFSQPSNIGGRFSVFTSVGLVPFFLLGFNVDALLEGAQKGILAATAPDRTSIAATFAAFLFEAYLQGMQVHELFLWNAELETIGKWYRQLLAESIGKERRDSTLIGITPTIAIGSTDLHSMGQLIFGGRNDHFTTFVCAKNAWEISQPIVEDSIFFLPIFKNKKTNQIPQAIYEGIKKTYEEQTLPFISIELEGINERELGVFMAIQMASVMYLAQLFDINAFDQPAVEVYKKNVRTTLLTN